MSMNSLRNTLASRLVLAALVAPLLLAACAAPPPPPLPERPVAPASDVVFDAGIDYAVDDLLTQARRLPAFAPAAPTGALSGLLKKDEPPAARGVIAVDPAIDGNTGQQTIASKLLDRRLLERAVARFSQFDVVPVGAPDALSKAQFLLAGTLTPVPVPNSARGAFRINLSLTDIRTGFVVAQSAARVANEGVDTTPTQFFRDSPSLTKDRVVEGQIRTAQAAAGSEADGVYMARMPVNALLAEGARLYEAANYAEALRYYESASARIDGQQLRVLNGLYLVNTQLGRTDAAEQAFAKIVALGLATNSLSVKFLFRPGSTDFLADPKISGPYSMWLRLVAREVAASGSCLSIVGHTSRTGAEQVNDRLSLQRAVAIQRRIETMAPETATRLQSAGIGSRENLVGSGTDDLRDSLDRRVEFRVRGC
ncbi:MAG TPA: OmpA family protein [Burkholderiaceae bacterium]|nr:OmpA family protein [Burkholderiaceae bacterium]